MIEKAETLSYVTGVSEKNQMFIECKVCGLKSFNEHDIKERYCGKCHTYHNVREFPPLFENDVCTECGEPCIKECTYPMKHRHCKNEHPWYWLNGEKRVSGDAVDFSDEHMFKEISGIFEKMMKDENARERITGMFGNLLKKIGIKIEGAEEVSRMDAFHELQLKFNTLLTDISANKDKIGEDQNTAISVLIAMQCAQTNFLIFIAGELFQITDLLRKQDERSQKE